MLAAAHHDASLGHRDGAQAKGSAGLIHHIQGTADARSLRCVERPRELEPLEARGDRLLRRPGLGSDMRQREGQVGEERPRARGQRDGLREAVPRAGRARGRGAVICMLLLGGCQRSARRCIAICI